MLIDSLLSISPSAAALLALCLATTSLVVWVIVSYVRLAGIPGPPLAALTNIPRALWVARNNAHETHIVMHRQYGPIVRFGPNMLSVADPAEIPHIYGFTGAFKKSDFYRVLSFFVKGRPIPGVFATQDEDVHRALRRPISGMYSMSSVVTYEPRVDTTLQVMFEQLDRRFAETGDECDFGKWLQMFAFDVVGDITFSKRLGFLETGSDVDNIMRNSWLYFRGAAPVTQIPWVDRVWTKNPVVQRLRQAKLNPIVAFAKARREERKAVDVDLKLANDDNRDSNADFLSRFIALEAKDPATPPWAVPAWSTSNITAGSDTTAILLRTIFHRLISHPESLAKLRKEVSSVIDVDTGIATWKEVQGLPYLDAVVKEAGRLHPPFGLPYERVVPPSGAVICGKPIPGGTVVGMSGFVVGQDRDVYGQDAADWRPERWLECSPEDRRTMENALLTFGHGHRSCIGKNISYLEIYKLVPSLILRYDFEFSVPKGASWKVENRWFSNQTGLLVQVRRRNLDAEIK